MTGAFALALAMVAVLETASVSAAQDRPEAKPVTPVAVSSLVSRGDAFVGTRVSVTGAVRQRVSDTGFTVGQSGPAGGPEILVLAERLTLPVDPQADVTVIGDVVRFGGADIATRTTGLAPAVVAAFQGKAALLATSVLTAGGVDLTAPVPAGGTAPPKSPQHTLACAFPLSARGTWPNAVPRAEQKPASLSMRFESIRVAEGTARVVAEAGAGEVVVRTSPAALHFIQVFNFGALYVTTVFDWGGRGSRLKAVHTRHDEFWLGQYYGDCEMTP